jgi:hypothetical protein
MRWSSPAPLIFSSSSSLPEIAILLETEAVVPIRLVVAQLILPDFTRNELTAYIFFFVYENGFFQYSS